MIRVLLADDETIIRAGVRSILTTEPGIEVVAEASDGREAVELARKHRPTWPCSTSGCRRWTA